MSTLSLLWSMIHLAMSPGGNMEKGDVKVL